jgi:hypothetical protein
VAVRAHAATVFLLLERGDYLVELLKTLWHLRAFKGYVVTRRALRHLPAAPPGYEISFIPPIGLSGAPLMIGDFAPRAIAGIV